MELIASEWGQPKIFPLPFVTYGATDYLTGVTLATGDVKISKDGGAFANIATLPTVLGAWAIITLSAAEMQARSIIIQFIDQTATKVFEDNGAILSTDVKAWQQALFTLIESQRGSHTGGHDQIFWDPINGNDSNSGLSWHRAKLTYDFEGANGVHSLLIANAHQIVHLLPQQGGAPTTVNEYVEVDSAYTFLRGPGRDFLIEADHNESCAVLASAEGVELSGFRVKTKIAGSQDGICSSGEFALIHNVWVDYSRGSGIVIDNTSSCIIDKFLVQDAAKGGSGHAVHILGDTSLATRNIVGAGNIFANGNGGDTDGVRVDGANCIHNFITGGDTGLIVHENTGWGINEVNGANHTIVVGPKISLHHNTLGDSNFVGEDSIILNHEQWAKDEDLQAVIAAIAALPTTPVTVVAGGGNVDPAYAEVNERSEIVQGDVVSIVRYLEGDHSSKTLFFGAKTESGDDIYAVGVIQCNNISYSAETDKTSYAIPFIASDTENTSASIYKGETEIRDNDGISNPVTGDRYDFEVIGQIITP